jgi:hypothetical protein
VGTFSNYEKAKIAVALITVLTMAVIAICKWIGI